MTTDVFIAAGSNLGDRFQNLCAARTLLSENPELKMLRSSPFYETEPVGGPEGQGKYLNAVWHFRTSLEADELLRYLHSVEEALGRERREPDAPRTLDLDILTYGDSAVESDALKIPHPRMHERTFVLKPFCDLAPRWKHPVLGKTAKEMLEACHASPQKA